MADNMDADANNAEAQPEGQPQQSADQAAKKADDAGSLGPAALARFAWTQLTSMRTALTLLFLGAIAAIPGSVIPQRSIDAVKVKSFIEENPKLSEFYEKVGLFEVYTSPWFSAIYLLLLVSLIGCIIPRIGVYAKAARAQPVATPKRLSRLPAYTSGAVQVDALNRAEELLKKKHFRIRREGNSISAERGYLRELGNLVFHLSLVTLLLGIAIGVLFGYRGSAVVVVGNGFANNITQYDDLTSGARFTERDLQPFSVLVDQFDVRFETGEINTGQPREFTAKVRVIERPGAAPTEQTIQVNHPLQLGATQVHLLAHGYAPKFTVRDGSGNVAWSGPSVFLPQDGNFTSSGIINAADARPQRLAFEGIFVPTMNPDMAMPRSLFPDAYNPQVFLNAYAGPPKPEDGVPRSVYRLDKTGLEQLHQDNGDLLRFTLKEGESYELPNGAGSVSYDGYTRWVKLQMSHTPGTTISLVSLFFGVLGLCLSLFVRPRRLWVRVLDDGKVEVAGLDRADARSGLAADVDALAAVAAEEGTFEPISEEDTLELD